MRKPNGGSKVEPYGCMKETKTQFFHKYANERRARNFIWKIKDDRGGFAVSQEDITKQGVGFFKKQYGRANEIAFNDIRWGIDLMPEMFDQEKNKALFRPVDENELLEVMKSFKKDKSPGPDGWSIDFMIHFFYLFKKDLLSMVEASRLSGNIHNHTSSTLIALIPKKDEPESFLDFRPISLCNIIFKIITKIIVVRIKGTPASCLSPNQHAFLKGRNIHDAVASTQECLHSMSVHNSNATIMKIDLQKAFDVLDWGYLQSLLAKIDLNSGPIRWIMARIENINYAVLINGCPSPFFRVERGLRQGCPLSPLLFILAIDALSLHINRAVAVKEYIPVKICKQIYISHNLFVDDVLLFAMLSKVTWLCIKSIMDRFQKASGLAINKAKSILYHNGTNETLTSWISQLFGIESRLLSDGIKYLGFRLKAKAYRKDDWR